MFSVLKTRAEKKIRATSTEEEVQRLVPKATKLAFKHVLTKERSLNESCYSMTSVFFLSWLKALKNDKDAHREALEAVKDMDRN